MNNTLSHRWTADGDLREPTQRPAASFITFWRRTHWLRESLHPWQRWSQFPFPATSSLSNCCSEYEGDPLSVLLSVPPLPPYVTTHNRRLPPPCVGTKRPITVTSPKTLLSTLSAKSIKVADYCLLLKSDRIFGFFAFANKMSTNAGDLLARVPPLWEFNIFV